ncbi:zinc finger protein 665-like [Anopheles maculipalpis]|uniref:zinc finger protein 665-like n=1 Tax=Anopheles maculipalpis TaxID=1496333 RepID=UPI002158E8CE|nr:zinc finger protein 665-like [Anopheles maculipalpis]
MNQIAVCRVCASSETLLELVDIFVKHEEQECIADILLELAGIQATVDDGFPHSCCSQCHSDLIIAVSVRRKCIESEKLIRQSLDFNLSLAHVVDQPDDVSVISSLNEPILTYHCWECSLDFCSKAPLQDHYESFHANAIHGWKTFGISEVSMFDSTDDEHEVVEMVEDPTTEENFFVPPPQIHRCCGCLLSFDTDAELKQHSDMVHASKAIHVDGSRTFQCKVCHRLFTTASALENHQNMEYLSRFQCATCGLLFGTNVQLTRHEFKHMHGKFTCDICDKIFSSPEYLKNHMKNLHTNARATKLQHQQQQHVCNQCGKRVNSASYLRVHMRLHSNEQPFSCNLCGARFKLISYLKWHMAVHIGLYKCKQCNASFKSPSDLQDHMNSHKDSREFCCNLCGNGFFTQKALFKHMRKVHSQYKRKQV